MVDQPHGDKKQLRKRTLPAIPTALPMKNVPDVQISRIPATTNQQGLCLEQRLRPNSKALLFAKELRLNSRPSVDLVLRALHNLHRRHISLRTRFEFHEGRFWLTPLSPDSEPAIEVIDVTLLDPSNRDCPTDCMAKRMADAAWDPASSPLVRFAVLCNNSASLRLVVVWHHLVTDEESWGIFCSELLNELNDCIPPDPEFSYNDYAKWQATRVGTPEWRQSADYWDSQFNPPPAPTSIYGIQPAAHSGSDAASTQWRSLSDELVQGIHRFREQIGISTFRILFAAAFTLAHRLSGESDLTLGTTLRGRTFPGAAGMIGYFNNQAALRVRIEPDTTFTELIHKVDRQLSAAVRHQEYPFALVFLNSGMRRHGSSPWPFTFTKLPTDRHHPLTRGIPLGASAHPLAFYCDIQSNQIIFRVEHLHTGCDETTVSRLLDQYTTLLSAMISSPDIPISRHSLLSQADSSILPNPKALLERPAYPRVLDLFRSWAISQPQAEALRQLGIPISYSRLANGIQTSAEILRRRGVTTGSVVAVSGLMSPGLIAAAMAVWQAGGVLVLIDPRLPGTRIGVMLNVSGASHFVSVGTFHPKPDFLEPELHVLVRTTSDLPPESESGRSEFSPPSSGDAAYVFFTSGTTGTPKAVLGSHRGLAHFLDWQRSTFAVGAGDRVAQLTGLSFDVILREVFLPLTSGATLCLPDPDADLAPDCVLPWIQREGITLLHTVPTLARIWVTHPPPTTNLSNLRCVFFAGEPLLDQLVNDFRHTLQFTGRAINLYGPTETTLAKCFQEVPLPPDPGIQPVGQPLPHTQALILSPILHPCGIGEPGEIVIRTHFRSHGYINAPEETVRRFIPNPFLHHTDDLLYLSGDRGIYLPDGRIAILGRIDFQVKIRGIRIEPGEVEAVLVAHPDLAAAAVVAIKADSNSYRLAAYWVPKAGRVVVSSDLRAHLRQHLPESHIPDSFVSLTRLPLTPNGKLDRRALPEPDWNFSTSPAGRPPGTPNEQSIARIWCRLLKIDVVDAQTSFFDLGGHSLLALQMVAEVRQHTGCDISLPDLFLQPTVEALARLVDRSSTSPAIRPDLQSLIPIRDSGSGPVLFLLPGGNGGDRELYVHTVFAEKHLDPSIRFFALRARGHKSGTQPHRDLRQMAADYIHEMRSITDGPFHLIGDCTGGNVAFEVARQLQAAGAPVGLVALCDCSRPRLGEYSRYWINSRFQRFRQSLVGRVLFNAFKIPLIVTPAGRNFWKSKLARFKSAQASPSAPDSKAVSTKAPEGEYWTPLGERYRRTVTTHSPGQFDGSLLLFLSETHRHNPRMLAWAQHITGEVIVHPFTGDHWHYLWKNGPRLNQVIASVIRSHSGRVQTDPSS